MGEAEDQTHLPGVFDFAPKGPKLPTPRKQSPPWPLLEPVPVGTVNTGVRGDGISTYTTYIQR